MESTLTIYDKSGSEIISAPVTRESIRKRVLMIDNYLLLVFNHSSFFDFKKGCYIIYHDFRFEIMADVIPERLDNGWKYSLKFEANEGFLKKFSVAYRGQDVEEFVFALTTDLLSFGNLICDCINHELGSNWSVKAIPEEFADSIKTLSFKGEKLFDAINMIVSEFKCEWWIEENSDLVNICFGKLAFGTEELLEAGRSVKSISLKSGDDSSFGTRFYVFGSSRNLTSDYGQASQGGSANHISEVRLRLPNGMRYIDAWDNLAPEDIVHQVAFFDDIYPKNTDVVTKVDTVNRQIEGGGTFKAYVVTAANTPFLPSDIIKGEAFECVFESGALQGRTFELKINYNPDTWKPSDGFDKKFEIIHSKEGDIIIPNESFKPVVGDKFIITGVKLSATRIAEAEQELLDTGTKFAQEKSRDTSVCECPTNPVYCYENDKDYDIGQKVSLVDGDRFGAGRSSRIQGYEKKLWNPYEATYTVGDNPQYSRLGSIEGDIKASQYSERIGVTSGVGIYLIRDRFDNTHPTNYNAYSSLAAIRKFATNVLFYEHIDQPVRVKDDVEFNSVTSEEFTSKVFTSGLLGVGHRLWNGILELNEIIVRKAIHVFEIIIQKTSSVNGSTLTTPGGGMRIIQVDELPDGYNCFFNNDEGAVPNPYIVGDQILHQVFTGKGIGRYWRLVTEVGEDYFILSKTDCEAGSGIPAINDEVIQFGCRTDRSRQSAILTTSYGSDAPYTAYYSGIDNYSLEGKEVVREGNLNGIVDADLGQLTGFGLYAQNVFLKGVFKLMSGKTVDQAITDSKSEAIQAAKIQAEAIAQAEAKLAQTQAESYADGIVSEAEQNAINEAQKRLDALQIGGENVLSMYRLNGIDFRAGSTKEGEGTEVIFKARAVGIWAILPISNNISLIPVYTDFIISFDLRNTNDFGFEVTATSGVPTLLPLRKFINTTNEWKRLSAVYNSGNHTNIGGINLYGVGEIRHIKIELGNKPTDYSISLYDQQYQIDSAKSAAQTAQNTANAAQTAANNAQSSANAANNLLSDIASDNKLTAQEKQSAKKEWDIIVSEKTNIIAQGTKYGVSTSNYTAKYNTLNTYITPLLANLTTTSDIVGATFRVKFKEYYDARTELLKLVSDAAKTLADTANTAAQTAQTKADSAQNTADNAQQSVMQVTEQVTSLIADNEGIKMSVNTVSEKVDTAKNEAISAAATDAQNKADAAKNTAILDANRGKLFLRGTGFNNNASRQLIINNDGVNRAVGGRGLSLTIIRRSDHVIIDNINYDTYGPQSGLLAEKLNSLDSSVIVALTSFDAVTAGSFGEDLKNAIIRCGGSGGSAVNRMPYALVGIPGIGKGNGIEVITGNGSNDPYAEISTQIINGIPSGMNGAASSLSDQAKQDAIDAANTASQAKINLLKAQELAALDGKIDTEEQRAIADAQAKYNAAISEAQKKADAAKDAAIGAAATDATNKSNSAKSEAVNAAKTYTDGRTESMWKGWIDASALDENKYYPVVFSCPPGSRVTVRLEVALNSGTKPSWSTHSVGFSVRCVWSVNGSGWGTTPINRIIDDFAYSFATTCPAGSIGQITNSSHEYIYVRGGGKYHFTIINSGTPFLVTDTYTNNSQTIYTKTSIDTPEITGATKAEVSAQLEVLTGEISAKVSQTIYDSEKQVINSSLSQLRLDYNSINLTVSNVNTRLNTIEQSGMVTQSNFVTIFSQKKDALGGDIIASINVAPESVKIKAKNISLEGLVTVNGYVQITAAGKLIAGDGEFSGKITATKGFIGGFTIDSNKLSVGNPSSQYGNSTLISPSKIILNNTSSSYMGSVTSGTKVELGVTNDYGGKAPFYFFRKDTILNAFRPAMSIESDCGDKVSIALTTKGSIISDRAIIDTGWGEMDASLYTVINFWVSTNITVISHSYRYIYFPTKESVFSLMGETRRFAIRIVILSYMHNGANFIIGGSRNISKLFNFNGDVHGDLEMGKGDVAEFLLVWDGYTYYARLISLGR